MANTVFAALGKFFFQFGLVAFILSIIYVSILNAYGIPVPSTLSLMATVLPTVGIFSVVMGVFGTGMQFVRVFYPQASQFASATIYLSLFLSSVTGVVALLTSIASMLPLPAPVVIALVSAISTIAPATIAYYLAVKMGYLPPE